MWEGRVSLILIYMDVKDIIGLTAAVINLAGYVPYFMGIHKGRVHPHVFSWFVWGLLTSIAVAAQIAGGAGPGMWVTAVSAVACLIIAGFALRYGEKHITRSDWVAFIAALSAIPLWIVTKDPLWSVILITLIDAVAFWPTFRKSWSKPWDEAVATYIISSLKFVIGFFALTNVSLVTALYPISLVVLNGSFTVMILLRRRIVAVK